MLKSETIANCTGFMICHCIALCSSVLIIKVSEEGSGSVVECLTRDRGVAGSSLTSVLEQDTLLSTGSIQEDSSDITEKNC